MRDVFLRLGTNVAVLIGAVLILGVYFKWWLFSNGIWIALGILALCMSVLSFAGISKGFARAHLNAYNVSVFGVGIWMILAGLNVISLELMMFFCLLLSCIVFSLFGVYDEFRKRKSN